MFAEQDYFNIKTLDNIAKRTGGTIPNNFRTFYNKYLLNKETELINFITKNS